MDRRNYMGLAAVGATGLILRGDALPTPIETRSEMM